MLDDPAVQTPPPPMQRARGHAGVRIGPQGRLTALHQSGAAKAMLPQMHGRSPEVVFLNTAGGVTGGDRFTYDLDIDMGVTAVGTTQTAERAYRSVGDATARIETQITLGAHSTLHWVPQETIVFDGASLDRCLTIDMPATARLVMLETLILGRTAMGETLAHLHLTDRRIVRRDGRPAMIESIRLTDADFCRKGTAGLHGAVALATLSYFAPDASHRLDPLRQVLPNGSATPVRAAASAWDGRVVARFTATDGFALRCAVAAAIPILTHAPLPRVWQV